MNTEILRPHNFDDIIGLDHIKKILKYEVLGAKILGEQPNHVILDGPAGTGKTTVCLVLASLLGGVVHRYLAADIKTPQQIYELATQVKNNDIVMLEEAHGLARKPESTLLPWLDEGKLLGGGAYGVLQAPQCVFVLSTTSSGRLSPAMRSRCKILTTSYYSEDEMCEIIKRAANKLNIDVSKDPDALLALARSSRATPRTALINRLDPLRKMMAVDKMDFDLKAVEKFFETHHVNPFGLEANDMLYCNTLYNKLQEGSGRPVSSRTLSQTTGLAEDIVTYVIEPYLHQIGIIKIDTRGRSFTEHGYEILGFTPIIPRKISGTVYNQIDLDALRTLMEDEKVRHEGMRAIARHFGLSYPQDNATIKSALNEIGYTSKQRVGIVRL